jgi:hypothetical protein
MVRQELFPIRLPSQHHSSCWVQGFTKWDGHLKVLAALPVEVPTLCNQVLCIWCGRWSTYRAAPTAAAAAAATSTATAGAVAAAAMQAVVWTPQSAFHSGVQIPAFSNEVLCRWGG